MKASFRQTFARADAMLCVRDGFVSTTDYTDGTDKSCGHQCHKTKTE